MMLRSRADFNGGTAEGLLGLRFLGTALKERKVHGDGGEDSEVQAAPGKEPLIGV